MTQLEETNKDLSMPDPITTISSSEGCFRFGDEETTFQAIDDSLTIQGSKEQLAEMFKDYIAYFGEVQNPENTKTNTFFNGAKYAPLNEVLNTIRPVMAKHNLGITQLTSTNIEVGAVTVTTMLMHKNGAYIIFPASKASE